MSGKLGKSDKPEKRDRSRERKAAKSPSQKSDVSVSSSASNAVVSTVSDFGTSIDSNGGTNSPAPPQDPSELARSISPRSKKAKKISQSSITADGSPLLREKLNSRSSSAGPSSGSASYESSSSPAPPFNMSLKSIRAGSHDHFVHHHYSSNHLFAVPSSPSGRSNLYNSGSGQSLHENGEEAELVTSLWREFQGQVVPALDSLVSRNKQLRAHVSMLLKASTVEEAPYLALAREKEAVSREYDQLRFEHVALQHEFLLLRRDHMESAALAQKLQCELDLLRSANSPTSSASVGASELLNSQNLSASDFFLQPSGLTSSQGSSTAPSSVHSTNPSTPRSTTANGSYITGTTVFGVSSPYSGPPLTTSISSDLSAANGAMSSPRPFADPAAIPSDAVVASNSSPRLLSTSSPRMLLRRKDNVAELEQSILELEEEIRSPRAAAASTSPAPSPAPAESEKRHSRKPSSGEQTIKVKERRGSTDRETLAGTSPSTHLVTSKSKRKVPKSHSNDPPNTHSINSGANGSGNTSNPGSPNAASGRAKAPPERNVSAPLQAKSSIVSSGTPSGSPSVARGAISQPSSAHTTLTKDSISLNGGSTSNVSASNSTPRTAISAEDREEQRLAKYMGAYGAVRRTNTPKQSASRHSSGSAAPAVSHAEQSAFTALFKKWDSNDDGIIERSEFEAAAQAMNDDEQLKELASITIASLAKIHWEEVGLSSSSPVSLASALAFLSDCKLGHPNTSVFQIK